MARTELKTGPFTKGSNKTEGDYRKREGLPILWMVFLDCLSHFHW